VQAQLHRAGGGEQLVGDLLCMIVDPRISPASLDGRMERTRRRPLPSGALRPWEAVVAAVFLSASGFLLLWSVHNLEAALIALFALVKLYLPFTRSMHYIARFFAFLWVNWDDKPNLKGSEIEKKVGKWLNQSVSWSAPHIQSGQKWTDLALEVNLRDSIETRQ